MIAGAVKYFRFPIEYILHELSYTNLTLLSASIPDNGTKDGDGKKEGGEVVINGSDPSNNALVAKLLGY